MTGPEIETGNGSPAAGRYALVVVGGGPAGHAAVAAYREAGGRGRVLLASADTAPPYSRPPLSKDFLRGESEVDELPLEDPDFYAEHDIQLALRTRVTDLDPAAGRVRFDDDATVQADRIVLATGSAPTPLDVPGAGHLRYLRFLDEARTLRTEASTARTAVVVGSGFIGCEAAMSLAARGVQVTQVSREPTPQRGRLGEQASVRLARWLTGAGIRLITGQQVTAVEDGTARLTDGTAIPADVVLAAVGITPQAQLAVAAGLAVEHGRVLVDAHMATSHPRVLAAGDVVLAEHAVAGRRLAVEHWGDAERMGEIAGRTAAGQSDRWAQAPGFWSEIGPYTLKYAAWGDGFDSDRMVEHDGGGFTVWYTRAGETVGVLTHEADEDYDEGTRLLERRAPE